MDTYYIYHISGTKIGCTDNIPKRMKEQSFYEWEILEVHTDIYLASDREIELQKQYGYKVDTIPYWKSRQIHHNKIVSDNTKSKMANSQRGSIKNHQTRKRMSDSHQKFSQELAQELKTKYDSGIYTFRSLSDEYQISPSTIHYLIKKKGTHL